jgi:hypothetical protein
MDEVREYTDKMLGSILVTHQTGPEGLPNAPDWPGRLARQHGVYRAGFGYRPRALSQHAC